MFLTASVLLFYCLGLFLFSCPDLDVEGGQDRKNVLNMLAKAFHDLLFCLLWFNVTAEGVSGLFIH